MKVGKYSQGNISERTEKTITGKDRKRDTKTRGSVQEIQNPNNRNSRKKEEI